MDPLSLEHKVELDTKITHTNFDFDTSKTAEKIIHCLINSSNGVFLFEKQKCVSSQDTP